MDIEERIKEIIKKGQRDKEIVKMYASGRSIYKIAKLYNLSPQRVSAILRREFGMPLVTYRNKCGCGQREDE